MTHFKSNVDFVIFFNGFSVYFGKCHKSSYNVWHFLNYAGKYFIIKKSTFDSVRFDHHSFTVMKKKLATIFQFTPKGILLLVFPKKKKSKWPIYWNLLSCPASVNYKLYYVGTYMCVRPSQHLEYLYPPSGNPVKVYLIAKSFVSL